MPVFKNISNHVFQDGDLEVLPGKSFTTEDEERLKKMRGLYKWRFSESEGGDAPSQSDPEVDATQTGARELREGSRVQLGDEAN